MDDGVFDMDTGITPQDGIKEDILAGVWPGLDDSNRITRFVSCHFAGEVEDYHPFSVWAQSQANDNPSGKIRL